MNLRLLFAIKTPLTDFPCSNGHDIERSITRRSTNERVYARRHARRAGRRPMGGGTAGECAMRVLSQRPRVGDRLIDHSVSRASY